MCPYIVDWSMRDEMSGMPKNTFDAIQLFPVCLTFSTVQWGFKHVTLQCHFNQPRPFSHYRAKEAFDFDGHRFIEKKHLRHKGILIH